MKMRCDTKMFQLVSISKCSHSDISVTVIFPQKLYLFLVIFILFFPLESFHCMFCCCIF